MNSLLLQYLTPCGRASRSVFWKRQALLALLLYPAILLSVLSFNAVSPESGWLIQVLLLCVATAGCVLSLGAAFGALVTLFFLSWGGMPAELQPFYEASPALLWPLFALSFALVLLLVWSSLAFVLRRLRDTRPGLLLLPLCLPFLWWMIAFTCIKPLGWRVFQEYRSVADTLFWVFCLTSFICTCLPARRA